MDDATIGEILQASGGAIKTGPFGTKLAASEYSDSGVPVVSVGEIGHGQIRVSERTKRVGSTVTDRLPEYLLEPGDIVFGRKGAVDRSAWVRPNQAGWFLGSDGIRLRFGEGVDSRFMAYQLGSLRIREWLLQHAIGTTLASLNEPTLKSVPVSLPPIEEQSAIAGTLGALDDKIESNQRAQAIGQDLLRALVEDSLLNCAGSMGRFSDYCTLIREYAEPASLTCDDLYVALKNMPRGSLILNEWGHAGGVGSQKWRFERGDILFGKLRPYFRKVGIAPASGVCSTDILVIRPKEAADCALISVVASSPDLIDRLSASASGTRMPRASWADLADWPVRKLDLSERRRLASACQPIVDRLLRFTAESHSLGHLRDSLLPVLLSGQLRVREAS